MEILGMGASYMPFFLSTPANVVVQQKSFNPNDRGTRSIQISGEFGLQNSIPRFIFHHGALWCFKAIFWSSSWRKGVSSFRAAGWRPLALGWCRQDCLRGFGAEIKLSDFFAHFLNLNEWIIWIIGCQISNFYCSWECSWSELASTGQFSLIWLLQ